MGRFGAEARRETRRIERQNSQKRERVETEAPVPAAKPGL
jgi:hypothetical protein